MQRGCACSPFFIAVSGSPNSFAKEKEMEYKEFLNAVCDYINESSGEVHVSIHSATKNNGVRLSGLSFSKEGYNAAPTIYMENYYADYLNGEDICEIGERLLRLYNENDLAVKLDMSFFDDFDSVKDRLFIKLINRSSNRDFLEEVPYEEYLDLAIVAYVRIHDKKIGNGIIMVRHEHCRMWGTDPETVLFTAKKNTHDHDAFTIRHITEVLASMGNTSLRECCDRNDFPMYVATNRKMTNGASVLVMNDKLREFYKVIGGDYYIIPSSVHELILLGCASTDRSVDINRMIRDVNRTQLGPDDVLSDHAYLYSPDDGVLIF